MTDNLRDRIAAEVLAECAVSSPAAYRVADAVTDLLIDMTGRGELLKPIDRMYRDV
jgi:hypothetical protein